MKPPYPSSAAIDLAVQRVLANAKSRNVPLRKIAWLAPDEPWNDSLGALFFYDTDAQLKSHSIGGANEWLRQELTAQLESLKTVLPFERVPNQISVEFDSHENVVKNFQGSYFLRTR